MVQRHDHLAHCVRDEALARASKASEPRGGVSREVASTLHLHFLSDLVDELHTPVVTGLPTDCYVDKIRLEPPASSCEGPCSSFHGHESSSVSFEGSFGFEH